ncbi:MAG TPA: hypothetical protein VIL00_05010 [Pseudonocardiaceae bacterium]
MIDLPASRYGVWSTRELVARVGRRRLRALVRAGWLRELWPRVHVRADLVRDPATRAAAALCYAGPGAVLSGPTAALLHGCTAVDRWEDRRLVHVTVPRWRRPPDQPGLRIHRAVVHEDDVVELDGLRVFTLDHVLADLLHRAPVPVARACLEQALAAFAEARPEQLREAVRRRLARYGPVDRPGTTRGWTSAMVRPGARYPLTTGRPGDRALTTVL